MGSMLGADPGQLEDLGRRMDAAANRLDAIRADVTADLNHSHWEGGDADDFRADWNHRLSGLLHTAALAAHEAGTILRRNAHQQREASGDNAGGGVAWQAGVGGGSDATGVDGLVDDFFAGAGAAFLAGGVLNLPFDALKELRKHKTLVNELRRHKVPGVAKLLGKAEPDLIKDVKLERLIKGGPALNAAADGIKTAGPLMILGTALDIANFQHEFSTDRSSAATWTAGADLVFDSAEVVAAFACPPLALGIAGAHAAYDVASMLDPNLTKDVVHGMNVVGQTIGQAEVDVVEAGAHAVGNAAGAAAKVVSGGVNAVLSGFHL